jgi:hypothetical protein
LIPDGPGPSADDPQDAASVVLAALTDAQQQQVLERAAHVREVLTGYRAGAPDLVAEGEPRPAYCPQLPATTRYSAKAAELGVGLRAGDLRVEVLSCESERSFP